MRSFRFSLQRVLNYRGTVEEALLTELAAIRSAYDHELGRLAEFTSARDMFHDMMKRELASGDPDHIRRAYHYLRELSERVNAQELEVQQLAKRKDSKTVEVVRASKDRKVLERLREYRAAEHKRESLREEQKFLDDVAGTQHRRRKEGRWRSPQRSGR